MNVTKIRRGNKEENKDSNNARSAERNRTCKYCGRTHLLQKELCPAYGEFCSKCGNLSTSPLYRLEGHVEFPVENDLPIPILT